MHKHKYKLASVDRVFYLFECPCGHARLWSKAQFKVLIGSYS
jgi:hypothetical protein